MLLCQRIQLRLKFTTSHTTLATPTEPGNEAGSVTKIWGREGGGADKSRFKNLDRLKRSTDEHFYLHFYQMFYLYVCIADH